jgi:lipoprotein-releasing system permease protein
LNVLEYYKIQVCLSKIYCKIKILNTEFFIAKRIIFSKENQRKISNTVVRIAVIGITLGMVVMILSIAISTGFKVAIREKIIAFGSHIQLTVYDSDNSFESKPISKIQGFNNKLKNLKGIKHIQTFSTKAGIIKTKNDIQGVILKGVGSDYDWSYFNNNIIKGKCLRIQDSLVSDKILISKYISNLLNLNVGDYVPMYFIQNPLRMRKFKVEGIYKTNIEDFDKYFVFTDISHVQKLNGWSENQVGGFEILLDNFDNLDLIGNKVNDIIESDDNPESSGIMVQTIKEKYPQLFDWMNLIDTNVLVIILLMLIVAGFNMVSGLLILILERTNMIGVLKALGAENKSIRKIFLYYGGFLISRGMLWGNIIGITLCIIQYYFGIFKLNEVSYYVSEVPVKLKLIHLLLLNIGTLCATISMLIIPSYFITKINTVKAIEYT